MNNFFKRTISGIGFAAIMLAAFLTNQYVFGAVMLFCLIVMMWEFLHITCGKEYKYSQLLSILAGATLFTLVYCFKAGWLPGRLVILAFVPVFLLMINSLYVKDKSRFDKFANLYTAILYIAVPWSVLNFAVFAQDGGAFNGHLILCFFGIGFVMGIVDAVTFSALHLVRSSARSFSLPFHLRSHGSDSGEEC